MDPAYWIRDEAWAAIEPYLPKNQPGAPLADDRRIRGILYVLRSRCRWRDSPAAYGPRTTVFNRANLWSIQGVWRRFFRNSPLAASPRNSP